MSMNIVLAVLFGMVIGFNIAIIIGVLMVTKENKKKEPTKDEWRQD